MTTEFSPDDLPIHYDEQLDTYRVQYDWTDPTPLTTTIVEMIGTISETPADDLTPLYETIDPDALEELLAPGGDSPSAAGIWFHYAGYRVTVRGEGEIEVTPALDPADGSGPDVEE
jgi:hypothetical protein